jgi:methyl-accepting chemotaxis protein
MTASDMVAGVYASLASLRGWLITGSKAFNAERAGVCTEKLKPNVAIRPEERVKL